MKIDNLRLGFATNSSSKHSVIIFQDGHDHKDDLIETRGEMYGWEKFVLAGKESKKRYLAQQLNETLKENFNQNVVDAIIKDLLGIKPDAQGYIDHQSRWGFPTAWPDNTQLNPHNIICGIDHEYVMDMKKYLYDSRLVIFGGNDNEEGSKYDGPGERVSDWLKHEQDDLVARKEGSWWILFNQVSGAKTVLSFKDNPEKRIRAETPELVDISITDYCNKGCDYCYKSSTKQGEHAKLDDIYYIAEQLKDMKVFEVAIGGGEPTAHPDFLKILKIFRNSGIVPSFSTGSISWLRDSRCMEIIDTCGAFAYSMGRKDKLQQFTTALVYHYIPLNKAYVHIPMGTITNNSFKQLLLDVERFGLSNIVLLGYKRVGRGAQLLNRVGYKEYYPYKDWLAKILRKNSRLNISFDTVLISEMQKDLTKIGTPRMLMHTMEGETSMYVDAVSLQVGPSSFQPDLLKPFQQHDRNSLRSIWDSMDRVSV